MGSSTVSIAFNGAFFAWPYHAGVATYIQERGWLGDGSRIYGVSSGAVVGMMLACGVDIAGVGVPAALEANERAHHRIPMFRTRGVLERYFAMFDHALPADAHLRASGRLFIAVNQLPTLRKCLVSQFATREALLQVIGATIAVPGLTVPFAYHLPTLGWCVDGHTVPGDDRPGVKTLRIGVGISKRMRGDIEPSKPITWDHVYLVQPAKKRRPLFELGYADARRHLEAA